MALLPESTEATELIQKAARLNIRVQKYSPNDKHAELWNGVADYARNLKRNAEAKLVMTPVSTAAHPFEDTKKYLAACYARASVRSDESPLRAIVVEGMLSAALQDEHPKSMGLADMQEQIRKSLGLKGAEVSLLVEYSLKQLIEAGLVRKHAADDGGKGSRYAWKSASKESSTLDDAIETLKESICKRAYALLGWNPPANVADTVKILMKEVIHQRGWDLGAAFASGKAPEVVSIRQILMSYGLKLSAFDRERLEQVLTNMFQHPTEVEASLLGELGRVSFALELAFQAPRTTLLHKATLPSRLYLDANILLPALVEGHPHHQIYKNTLERLRSASNTAGDRVTLVACYGYLNEMISHKNAAIEYARDAGVDFDDIARNDATYNGPGNINVYVGAYANAKANGWKLNFESFLARVAPYATEIELSKWLEKKGISVIRPIKNGAYLEIYSHLERTNASKLTVGKQPILVEHDALQLAVLSDDATKGIRSIFVTADRKLYNDLLDSKSKYKGLTEFMVSHIGIVQLVDLLVGLKNEDKAFGNMIWSSHVSEKSQQLRSYLTLEALTKYDVGLSMDMHAIVEAQSESIAEQLDRQGQDLGSLDSKNRIQAFRSLGTLEADFFRRIEGKQRPSPKSL
ncbi:hypothetical protein [Herbaspirillum huttiense]|uniref:hypothetical protein n=1 Tax=Herbaspirillum huttiense TaxID=863372 RepID=UPI002176AF80|nr:hypothetical protein [Herbaspirillum huttiense]UWE17854.1 hypothetical protein NY669_06675 [Herbaspirillum huttiense]